MTLVWGWLRRIHLFQIIVFQRNTMAFGWQYSKRKALCFCLKIWQKMWHHTCMCCVNKPANIWNNIKKNYKFLLFNFYSFFSVEYTNQTKKSLNLNCFSLICSYILRKRVSLLMLCCIVACKFCHYRFRRLSKTPNDSISTESKILKPLNNGFLYW